MQEEYEAQINEIKDINHFSEESYEEKIS